MELGNASVSIELAVVHNREKTAHTRGKNQNNIKRKENNHFLIEFTLPSSKIPSLNCLAWSMTVLGK